MDDVSKLITQYNKASNSEEISKRRHEWNYTYRAEYTSFFAVPFGSENVLDIDRKQAQYFGHR